MTKENATLIPKDSQKGTAPNNHKPIKCLLMMWKILRAQIREEIYDLLISHWLFPGEQKGCCKWTRATEELLYINQHILKEIMIICIKMNLALNNLQRLICHKTQQSTQPQRNLLYINQHILKEIMIFYIKWIWH